MKNTKNVRLKKEVTIFMTLNTDKLEIHMANACMTYEDLAKKSGLSLNTLYSFKREQRNPRGITLGKIARALKVDVTQIID
jgi:transcriptional regulator with XRE-family HTH domain